MTVTVTMNGKGNYDDDIPMADDDGRWKWQREWYYLLWFFHFGWKQRFSVMIVICSFSQNTNSKWPISQNSFMTLFLRHSVGAHHQLDSIHMLAVIWHFNRLVSPHPHRSPLALVGFSVREHVWACVCVKRLTEFSANNSKFRIKLMPFRAIIVSKRMLQTFESMPFCMKIFVSKWNF